MQSIAKIGKCFWYMTPVSETDRPILGMVVGNRHSLMIDAGNSEAHANLFLEELAKVKVSKPDMVALTHWHWDHIFGLSALKETVSFSSRQTKKEIEKLLPLSWSDEAIDARVQEGTEIEFCASAIKKEFPDHRDIRIMLPEITFKEKVEIDLGGVTCVLEHVGGDHAADSVVVYIKEEKILFLADCLYADIFSAKRNYTIDGTLSLLEKLDKYDAESYILSHWRPISKMEFQDEVRTLKTIAYLTGVFNGDKARIIEDYGKDVGRDITEDELDTIQEFINGYITGTEI